jgi:hypothetical protein
MKEASGTRLVGTYVQYSAPHDLQRTSTNRPLAPVSSAKLGIPGRGGFWRIPGFGIRQVQSFRVPRQLPETPPKVYQLISDDEH